MLLFVLLWWWGGGGLNEKLRLCWEVSGFYPDFRRCYKALRKGLVGFRDLRPCARRQKPPSHSSQLLVSQFGKAPCAHIVQTWGLKWLYRNPVKAYVYTLHGIWSLKEP